MTPNGSGTTTLITMDSSTLISWRNFSSGANDELQFQFGSPNDSVLNLVEGTGSGFFRGRLESNGRVGVVAPNGNLVFSGEGQTRGLLLSTLDLDSANTDHWLNGRSATFGGQGNPGVRVLQVTGSGITADGGDLVLVGNLVSVDAPLSASGTIALGGGQSVTLDPLDPARVSGTGSSGVVVNLRRLEAETISIKAGREINNNGSLVAGRGAGRIFLEVGSGGEIINDGNGVILGNRGLVGAFNDEGLSLDPNDPSNPNGVTSTMTRLPRRSSGVARQTRSVNQASISSVRLTGRRGLPVKAKAKTPKPVAKRKSEKKTIFRGGTFFGKRYGK